MAQYIQDPDDWTLWKPSLNVLHTSVDLPGESVSVYQGCNRISELCMCVFILFLLRVTGSFAVRYGSECIER